MTLIQNISRSREWWGGEGGRGGGDGGGGGWEGKRHREKQAECEAGDCDDDGVSHFVVAVAVLNVEWEAVAARRGAACYPCGNEST